MALAAVLFSLVLVYFGWRMMMTGTRRFTPMMGYPMTYVFAAFPVAGIAFLLFSVEQLIAAVRRYPPRHAPHTEIGSE